MENIYASIPGALKEELLEILLAAKGFRLERIVSKGHTTPAGEWCDQEMGEWVILLKGGAGLRFEGQKELWVMKPGDYVLIPPHSRHRVEWTEAGETTIWLAFHYSAGAGGGV